MIVLDNGTNFGLLVTGSIEMPESNWPSVLRMPIFGFSKVIAFLEGEYGICPLFQIGSEDNLKAPGAFDLISPYMGLISSSLQNMMGRSSPLERMGLIIEALGIDVGAEAFYAVNPDVTMEDLQETVRQEASKKGVVPWLT